MLPSGGPTSYLHVLDFLSTQDLLRLSQTSEDVKCWVSDNYSFMNLTNYMELNIVSTVDVRLTFIHTLFDSVEDLCEFLAMLDSSDISVPYLVYVLYLFDYIQLE